MADAESDIYDFKAEKEISAVERANINHKWNLGQPQPFWKTIHIKQKQKVFLHALVRRPRFWNRIINHQIKQTRDLDLTKL